MNYQMIIYCIILSLVMFLALNWIYFFDWVGLIGKLVKIIAPQKKVREIELNQKLREHEKFKMHIKKWKKIFLIHPVSFTMVFLILIFAIRKMLIAYFCGLIVILIEYGILCNKEKNEREKIKFLLNDSNNI